MVGSSSPDASFSSSSRGHRHSSRVGFSSEVSPFRLALSFSVSLLPLSLLLLSALPSCLLFFHSVSLSLCLFFLPLTWSLSLFSRFFSDSNRALPFFRTFFSTTALFESSFLAFLSSRFSSSAQKALLARHQDREGQASSSVTLKKVRHWPSEQRSNESEKGGKEGRVKEGAKEEVDFVLLCKAVNLRRPLSC